MLRVIDLGAVFHIAGHIDDLGAGQLPRQPLHKVNPVLPAQADVQKEKIRPPTGGESLFQLLHRADTGDVQLDVYKRQAPVCHRYGGHLRDV